jgi:hypothetical protein
MPMLTSLTANTPLRAAMGPGGLLVTRVDHNGKIFSDQVRKNRVVSIIQTDSDRIRGVVFHDIDARLKDYLNDTAEQFIAVAEVEFLSPDGTTLNRAEFLAVNKSRIQWIMPADAESAHLQS